MKYELRSAASTEAELFYTDSSDDRDILLGTVGHLRADFGSGEEFWTTWWPHNDDKLNTHEFKAELGAVVKELRSGLLSDLDGMRKYCYTHPDGAIGDRVYGYIAESENYRYCIRCTPEPDEYHAYIYAYDKRQQT